MVAPAQAGTIGCAAVNGNLANKISGSIGCEISGTIAAGGSLVPGESNDKVNGGNPNFANFTVNKEKFFTASNWLLAGKSTDNALEANFTPDKGPNGTYNLSGLFAIAPKNVMLIFKSGNETSLVGYLLDNRVNPFQGDWKTPFTEPPFSFSGSTKSKEVSHISVYYREGAPLAIPTPALLPGLIGLGLGVIRNKKKQAEQEA